MYGYETFHEKLAEGLIANVRGGNPPHAYIFEGDAGLGLFETARLFAASLACSADNSPCGVCNSCVSAKVESNPDIIVIKPEDKKKSISVEQMREMISDAYVKPFLAKRKVYIFADAGIATESAQNAILKLIEEPPEYAVFILICDNAERLLETIRSRCVKVRFSPLSEGEMAEYVDSISPGNAKRDFIVRYSAGIPQNAKNIIEDESFDHIRTETVKRLPLLFSQRKLTAYNLADFVEENKEKAALVLSLWAGLMRDIIFIHQGSVKLITNGDYERELTEVAARVEERAAVKALESIMLAEEMLRRYVSLRSLVLRMALSIKPN
ncbi:MAG: hypothetical protein UIM24_01015 [Clostridia bacterium]|nr:hypothetical protein [Clostridia bacterium]